MKLGFTKDDIVLMPYSKAAWYIGATNDAGGDDGSVVNATQADIDAF